MRIVILKETKSGESRVAATPETVKKLCALGADVILEKGAGFASQYLDAAYKEAGATLAKDAKTATKDASLVLKVQPPQGKSEMALLPKGAILIGLLAPYQNMDTLKAYAKQGINALSLELMPRITRAQNMDVLSSQSNLAGYRAVIEASQVYNRAFPMMMTAAGTVAPARVLVLGAGVAGLQAIATARRLGAIVSAFDVRAAAKEQVESLGATFIEVDAQKDAETKGGYAKEMSKEDQKRQAQKIHETLKTQDIVICTALIPGRPAPVLISEAMVKDMKPGAVIVDLAVEMGGNCSLSELDKVVTRHDVGIVGYGNMASRISHDASALYARNVFNLVKLLLAEKKNALHLDRADEIIAQILLTQDGKIVHENFQTT